MNNFKNNLYPSTGFSQIQKI